MNRGLLFIFIIASFCRLTDAKSPDRWNLFWQNHRAFKKVPGAEDYALQVTTNQYALDELSQELSRGVIESQRKEVLQEISERKSAVALLEEQIKTMEAQQIKAREAQ